MKKSIALFIIAIVFFTCSLKTSKVIVECHYMFYTCECEQYNVRQVIQGNEVLLNKDFNLKFKDATEKERIEKNLISNRDFRVWGEIQGTDINVDKIIIL